MANERLLEIIDARLAALNWSERKACLAADLNVDTIRRMRRRGQSVRPEILGKLAAALRISAATLLQAAAFDETAPPPKAETRRLRAIEVLGHVQAGDWRDAFEWPQGDRYPISIVDDGRHPGMQAIALEVRGDSMDQIYPHGSIVVVVRYGDLARQPASGERVVVLRRDAGGQYEATLKEYQLDAQGRHWLLPRSTNPDHRPILLGGSPIAPDGPLAEQLPAVAHARGFDDGAEPDVILLGLVVQSIRLE